MIASKPDKTENGRGELGLYCDARLGNVPRYVLTDRPESLMQIPDEIRKCVVFLGYKNSLGGISMAGTAFFANRSIDPDKQEIGFGYLITAKHVIDNIRAKLADKVLLRVNLKGGGAQWVESGIDSWLTHDEDPTVDVAVLKTHIPRVCDHIQYPLASMATEQVIATHKIGVGEEVFLTGLFVNHYGRHRNIPIIRVGNIAAMPEEKVATKDFGFIDAYLVEARSIGGLSGSPVFAYLGHTRYTGGGFSIASGPAVFYLLGIVHGHYDITAPDSDDISQDALQDERINMGIAIVVPATKIMEVIRQPMVRELEEKQTEEWRKSQLPTQDGLPDDAGLTQESFEEALRRASRKTPSPDEGKAEE